MSLTLLHLTVALATAAPGGLLSWGGQEKSAGACQHGCLEHHHWPVPSPYAAEARPPKQGCSICRPGGRVVAPGPGYGWGFPNGNPDGYGWVDYGTALPLGDDRTPDYFFNRAYGINPQVIFFPTYYNPYLQRGQRYIPYSGCGGAHSFGNVPTGDSWTPYRPSEEPQPEPAGDVPIFQGRVETAVPRLDVTPTSGVRAEKPQVRPATLP